MPRFSLLIPFLLLFTSPAALSQQSGFDPSTVLDKWRSAVLSGDSSALAALYTQNPPPSLSTSTGKPLSLADELQFWTSFKSKGLTDLTYDIADSQTPEAKLHLLLLQLTLTLKESGSLHKQYIVLAQGWVQRGDQQLIAVSQHTPAARLRPPLKNKDIYDSSADPNHQIVQALHAAAAAHKRVLVVFGGNWCFDCHVLDEAFHSQEIAPTVNKSFEVVHINIGNMDKNLDVAKKYDVPLDRGVPAIAVLDSDGKLLFSQKRGEFEAARSLGPEDILAFLNKWKPLSR
jgi:thioredoxin-related protein